MKMNEETKKRIEQRAQEILDEDPEKRNARVMRQLAERIAYLEMKAAEEEASERALSGGQ